MPIPINNIHFHSHGCRALFFALVILFRFVSLLKYSTHLFGEKCLFSYRDDRFLSLSRRARVFHLLTSCTVAGRKFECYDFRTESFLFFFLYFNLIQRLENRTASVSMMLHGGNLLFRWEMKLAECFFIHVKNGLVCAQ